MYWSASVPVPAVERIWFGDSDVDPAVGHRSDPVLGADLVFTLRDGAAHVALQGPLTTRRTYAHHPGSRYIGVRFRPGFGAIFEDVKLGDIRDHGCALDRLWHCSLDEVAEQLDRGNSATQARVLVDLLQRVELPTAPTPAVARALEHIVTRAGRTTATRVAQAANLSMRQLQRVMSDHLGMSTKTFIRLTRMQTLIDRCHNGPAQLAELAADLGFADQAHMTHEVRRVLFTTPAALCEESRQPAGESFEIG